MKSRLVLCHFADRLCLFSDSCDLINNDNSINFVSKKKDPVDLLLLFTLVADSLYLTLFFSFFKGLQKARVLTVDLVIAFSYYGSHCVTSGIGLYRFLYIFECGPAFQTRLLTTTSRDLK